MIYRNDDPRLQHVIDRALLSEEESGIVGAKCGICDESIFRGDEYYSNGDMDICCSCYADFSKIW